ncbi:NAD-dependent epimerase/dehydratase family protein [Portibacter marinus]|uniref:NAD-dependent epimerase/dehydratase family protein n=1 Tax=Portibacter marinus TaxID=2898660 RepID=UPI001F1D70DE|nr:NAD-dependent epimerase/dehydratase family protein [Portibacter marinus]
MKEKKILLTGANGQIGTALTKALREIHGTENVIATDITEPKHKNEPFDFIDILNKVRLKEYIGDYKITQIYHLAAILSASGELNPQKTWEVNMTGFLSILDIAVELKLDKIFFPSTIAVYGPTTLRLNTPQHVSLEPGTVYGISKVAGELWCNYYFKKYGLDSRSVRYPGIIGWQSIPQGGTTDYAVEMFHAAINGEKYECFLKADTKLPMMYMPDAIRATTELMEAEKDNIRVRTSYNLSAMSFSPSELVDEIRKHYPRFELTYKPDHRQEIASSWSESIDDSSARADWDWDPEYDISKMTEDMINNLT